ncbi:MAG: flavodoxin family protein [Candidatus Thorarchaeota archaeon]
MKSALVLYHSVFGNTKSVAQKLSQGLEAAGLEVKCLSIEDVDMSVIPNYDFIAIGSPTHMIRPSKKMKGFLIRLGKLNLSGLAGFSFDTRNESRMNRRGLLVLENSAARTIEKALKRMKVKIVRSRSSAIVIGREGPLESGVEASFFQLGREIGSTIAA